MALKGNYEFKGIEVNDAYISISEVKTFKKDVPVMGFNKDTSHYNREYVMEFKVEVYKDDTKKNLLDSLKYNCNYVLGGASVYVQAFNHLKTLDAYKDMIDLI